MKLFLRKQKGFTLIEVIVVLVIIAILAAIGVPSLTGYIDKTKLRPLLNEAKDAMTALTVLVDEQYAAQGKVSMSALWDSTYEQDKDYVIARKLGSELPQGVLQIQCFRINMNGAVKAQEEFEALTGKSAYFLNPSFNGGYAHHTAMLFLDSNNDDKIVGFLYFIVGEDDEAYAVSYDVRFSGGNWVRTPISASTVPQADKDKYAGWHIYRIEPVTDVPTLIY